jgi:predicted transposase/invertase (TIGR01784 family)
MPAEYEEMARRDEADRRQGAYSQGRIDGVEEGRQEGLQKGLQEGRQEGRQEEKIEVACNLLRAKMPVDLVAKGTGLSLEEVARLAAGLSDTV